MIGVDSGSRTTTGPAVSAPSTSSDRLRRADGRSTGRSGSDVCAAGLVQRNGVAIARRPRCGDRSRPLASVAYRRRHPGRAVSTAAVVAGVIVVRPGRRDQLTAGVGHQHVDRQVDRQSSRAARAIAAQRPSSSTSCRRSRGRAATRASSAATRPRRTATRVSSSGNRCVAGAAAESALTGTATTLPPRGRRLAGRTAHGSERSERAARRRPSRSAPSASAGNVSSGRAAPTRPCRPSSCRSPWRR